MALNHHNFTFYMEIKIINQRWLQQVVPGYWQMRHQIKDVLGTIINIDKFSIAKIYNSSKKENWTSWI